MFFILSKILAFIITPLVWIAGLLLYSFFTKNEKRKKKCFVAALIMLLFFSNSFILDEVMRLWEVPAAEQSELGKYDAAIILGGLASYDEQLERIQFVRSGDRLWQGVELYKKGYVKKIVFAGGSGSIAHPDIKEGILVQRYLLMLGIPAEDIIVESESRNTRENAVNTKAILDQKIPNGNYLLITSAFHMRRSMGCFKKVGITPVPYSTDRYSGPRKWELDHLLVPNVETLATWSTLLHEMVGCMVYKVSGYI
jgi:uncharacterized SAM-binding protein YcdF (DUF218 family)